MSSGQKKWADEIEQGVITKTAKVLEQHGTYQSAIHLLEVRDLLFNILRDDPPLTTRNREQLKNAYRIITNLTRSFK